MIRNYVYPNRERLPEEKRLYERSLEHASMQDQLDQFVDAEIPVDIDAEDGLAQEIDVDMNLAEGSGDEDMLEEEAIDEDGYIVDDGDAEGGN